MAARCTLCMRNPTTKNFRLGLRRAAYPKEDFKQITKRALPRGFGKSRTSAAFEREARKMFAFA
jgi:hypothetical protein